MGYQFNRETVTYQAGEATVSVVVREASRLQGLKRIELIEEARAWLTKQGFDNVDLATVATIPDETWRIFLVARFERSASLAAAEKMEGIPSKWLSIEGFATLMPEPLALRWVDAAYRLNDHWETEYRQSQAGFSEDEDEKKSD